METEQIFLNIEGQGQALHIKCVYLRQKLEPNQVPQVSQVPQFTWDFTIPLPPKARVTLPKVK